MRDQRGRMVEVLIRLLAIKLLAEQVVKAALEAQPWIALEDFGDIGGIKLCTGDADHVMEKPELCQARSIALEEIDVPGMERDIVPYPPGPIVRHVMSQEKLPGGIGALDLEAM